MNYEKEGVLYAAAKSGTYNQFPYSQEDPTKKNYATGVFLYARREKRHL